jgi:hypothetical protein
MMPQCDVWYVTQGTDFMVKNKIPRIYYDFASDFDQKLILYYLCFFIIFIFMNTLTGARWIENK